MAQMPSQMQDTNGPSLQESPLPPITSFANNMSMQQADFPPNVLPAPPILRNPSWGESARNGSISGQAMIGPRGSISMPSYPSPSDSSFGSPGLAGPTYTSNGYSSSMPPPMTSNPLAYQESVSSPYNGAKRVRLSPQTEVFNNNPSMMQRANMYGQGNVDDMARVQFNQAPTFFQPYSFSNPLTPAASATSICQDNEDRRISVSSLLSEDPTDPPGSKRPSTSDPGPTTVDPQAVEAPPRRGSLHQRMISYTETETYGHDRGQPDFDVPRNNDTLAISGMSPSEHSDFGSWLEAEFDDPSFGFGTGSREAVFSKGGYYASPVTIKIPRKLEPLPQTLSENPMNLLYFHHFLNHTAKILVPHDCPENPFKTVLPKSLFISSQVAS